MVANEAMVTSNRASMVAMFLNSESMVASKQHQRSHLTSESNSVTSTTYASMLSWPLMASISRSSYGEGQLSSIDLRGFAAGKKYGTELRNGPNIVTLSKKDIMEENSRAIPAKDC